MLIDSMRNLLISLAIKYEGDFYKIRKALQEEEKLNILTDQQAVTIVDEDYPRELLQLKQPPYVLFYRGNAELLKSRKIAVVGSRKAVKQGISATANLIKRIRNDLTIVSGMAWGIDRIAHMTAMTTIGVLGHGLDVIYPPANRDLYNYMEQHQLLLSEYPASVGVTRAHFPFRNRIIAGLSEKLVVTQARKRSGTMHTVSYMLDLGREVYAVPYRGDDWFADGCNQLIQQGAFMVNLETVREDLLNG